MDDDCTTDLANNIHADCLREIGEQINGLYSCGHFSCVLKIKIDVILFGVSAKYQGRLKSSIG